MGGHTLVELLLVLTLIGATTASLAPAARGYRDRASVVAARETMVGLLAETRQAAMRTGEARLRLSSDPPEAAVETADTTLRTLDFRGEFEVAVDWGDGQPAVALEFNGLGLGRMAGRTLRFRRGSATAELIVSSFGRVRRR